MELTQEIKGWVSRWAASRFFPRAQYQAVSRGSASAGMPVILNQEGKLDSSLFVSKLFTSSSSAEIEFGFITPTTSLVSVSSEIGSADDLEFLSGGALGEHVILRAASGHTITVKDGTGNLQLAGDFAMNSINDTLHLLCIGDDWVELGRSNNS